MQGFSRSRRNATTRATRMHRACIAWAREAKKASTMLENRAQAVKNRFPNASDRVSQRERRLRSAPAAFRTRLGAPGAAQERSWTFQDEPKSALGALRARSWEVPARPRSVPGAPRSAQNRSGGAWERFFFDFLYFRVDFPPFFRRFVDDVSSIFARAACDEDTYSESQKGVA